MRSAHNVIFSMKRKHQFIRRMNEILRLWRFTRIQRNYNILFYKRLLNAQLRRNSLTQKKRNTRILTFHDFIISYYIEIKSSSIKKAAVN